MRLYAARIDDEKRFYSCPATIVMALYRRCEPGASDGTAQSK